MAQTSLIIGDTNWAVKEDSLLGYNVIQNNYLPIPIDCVRATTATRVNEQGLIEIVPRNLLQYSQEFENAYWQKDAGVTVDSNVANSPNGSLTADRINFSTSGIALYRVIDFTTTAKLSVYLKGEGANIGKQIYLEIAGVGSVSVTLTAEWNRFVIDANNANAVAIKRLSGGQADSVLAWGIQLEQGSVATEYFPTTNRLDIPRIDYSTGTASLLVEPQRTNLITYSENLTDASYSSGFDAGGSVTRTANFGISPDGTQDATRLQIVRGATYAEFFKRISTTAGSTYTLSFYAKSLSGTPNLYTAYNGTYQNPITFTNQWVRYTYTFVASAAPSNGFNLITFNGLAGTSTTADLLVWGVQIELASYATSYIPTIASSVTRNADIIGRTGISGLIGQTEGVIFLDCKIYPTDTKRLAISDGTTANAIYFQSDATNRVRFLISQNSATILDTGNFTLANPNAFNKIAFKYKSNDFAIWVNGSEIYSSTAVALSFPVALSKFAFDFSASGLYFFGEVKSTQLYKIALSNTELAQLTTL